MLQYQYLTWDSAFFGYPVAALRAKLPINEQVIALKNQHTARASQQILQHLQQDKIKLLYTYNCAPAIVRMAISASASCMTEIENVANRCVYIKKIAATDPPPDKEVLNVVAVQAATLSPIDMAQLNSLAMQAGKYARFITDSHIPKTMAETMYRLWLQKAIPNSEPKQGQSNMQILVHRNANNTITGFILVKIDTALQRLQIQLLAVDATCRGQGIGSLLLQQTTQVAIQKQLRYITSATQSTNQASINLHVKQGFTLSETTEMLHLWLL